MRRTGLIPPITAMSDSGAACSPRPRSTVWHGGAQASEIQRPPCSLNLTGPAAEDASAAGRGQWRV